MSWPSISIDPDVGSMTRRIDFPVDGANVIGVPTEEPTIYRVVFFEVPNAHRVLLIGGDFRGVRSFELV